MSDWIVCPSCQLKQTLASNGSCKRCHGALDSASPIAPVALGPRPTGMASSEGLPAGSRIAGGVLILNAIALLLEAVMLPDVGAKPGGPFSGIAPAIFDVVVGCALLAGNEKMRPLAIVRAVLGLVVFGAIHLASGDTVMAVFQVAFSGAILALLLGSPGIPRAGIAVALLSLYFGVEALGLTGSTLLTRMMLQMSGELSGPAVTAVEGSAYKYRLTAPANGKWFLRDGEAAHKDNALADRWLIRPDADAHVMVIAEVLPGASGVALDDFAQVVLDNLKAGMTNVQVVENTPLPYEAKTAGRYLKVTAQTQAMAIHAHYGLFLSGTSAYQVMAFAPADAGPDIERDMKAVIHSFEVVR